MKATDIHAGLTEKRLKKFLRYSKKTGLFTRRESVVSKYGGVIYPKGSISGTVCKKSGYVRIGIDGRQYFAHRLAWFYVTGEWPIEDIDHKNLDRADNKWLNLREASRSKNCQNNRGKRHRKSEFVGVSECPRCPGTFIAQIHLSGKAIVLGRQHSEEAAYLLRLMAEQALFGEFAGSLRP